MKIVRLIEEFPPEINRGLSPNVYYISREQVKQGHQVWIFAFTKNKPTKEIKDGIIIYRIKKPNKIRWNGGVAFAQAIKKNGINPDIIHGLNCIPFGWRINRMRKILNCKYAMSLHTSILPLKHGYIKGFKNILRNLEFTYLAKYLAKKVDLVLPISNFISNELKNINIPSEKIKVVPPGIGFELFNQAQNTQKKEFPLKFIKLLYVGRFVQMKGLSYLLKACKILNDKNIYFKLYMIGGKKEDDDYKNIQNLIKEYGLEKNIVILPPISQDKLIPYYSEADIFILPSLYEPFGKVILEAQATGVPVIASRAGGIDDILGNNYLILVKPGSAENIFKSVINLMHNKSYYNDLRYRGYNNAKKYDWKIISNKLSRIYLNLLNNNEEIL